MATYTARGSQRNSALDEFETVGAKKSRFDDDSDSDDIRVPFAHQVNIDCDRHELNQAIAGAFSFVP